MPPVREKPEATGTKAAGGTTTDAGSASTAVAKVGAGAGAKAGSPPIVHAAGIRREFQMGDSTVTVLKHADLSIRGGEFIAIEGRSGSGKSTLLHILGALDTVESGTVEYEGQGYARLTPDAFFLSRRKREKANPLLAAADRGLGAVAEWLEDLPLLLQAGVVVVLVAALWLSLLFWVPHFIVFEGKAGRFVLVPSPLLLLLLVPILRLIIWLIRLLLGTAQGVLTLALHPARSPRRWRAAARMNRLASGLRNRQFGFVFQFYHLLPELNVLENTLLAPLIDQSLFGWFKARRAMRKRAIEVLDQLGMTHRLEHRPSQLSGGERQRVAIARALMNHPRVLYADEPTGNLDFETGQQIMGVLEQLHRERGQTIIMVTHDRALARQADRILVLRDGKLVEEVARGSC